MPRANPPQTLRKAALGNAAGDRAVQPGVHTTPTHSGVRIAGAGLTPCTETSYTETFTGSDLYAWTDIDQLWAKTVTGGPPTFNPMYLDSGGVVFGGGGFDRACMLVDLGSPDMEASIEVVAATLAPGADAFGVWLGVRSGPSSDLGGPGVFGFFIGYTGGMTDQTVYGLGSDANGSPDLGTVTEGGNTVNPGDVYTLRVVGDFVSALRNGTELLSATYNTFVSTAHYSGFGMEGGIGAAPPNGLVVDNFTAKNVCPYSGVFPE